MPTPTDDGKTYTFKIRQGVKFQDGSPLTAADVAASWNEIIFPPPGRARARGQNLRDGRQGRGARRDHRGVPPEIRHHAPSCRRSPIRTRDLREEDPRQGPALVREEHHGLRPVQVRQLRDWPVDQGDAQPQLLPQGPALSRRVRRHLFAAKQAVRVDAIRATARRSSSAACRRRRATAQAGTRRQDHRADQRLELRQPDHAELASSKPFDDVRVRRALLLAIDQWHGAPALSKIADVQHRRRHRVSRARRWPRPRPSCEKIAGFWPDIEKSRAEARRLLKEAGAGGPAASNCSTATSISRTSTSAPGSSTSGARSACTSRRRSCRPGRGSQAMRSGNFDVVVEANCNGVVNPLMDTQKYLPHAVVRRELRRLRGPEGDRHLRQDAARDRLRQAAGADAPVRDAT